MLSVSLTQWNSDQAGNEGICGSLSLEFNKIVLFVRFESNQIAQTNETSAIELVKFTETVLRAAHPQGSDFVVFDVR